MRKKFIAGNWKMNKTVDEAKEYASNFKELISEINNIDIVLCAPFTLLPELKNSTQGTNIKLAAQNMYFEDSGAYTGEISPLMIKEFCDYVVVGHSERRKYFNETNSILNKKIKKALVHNIKIIFCCGETLEENESEQTQKVIQKQITEGLSDISKEDLNQMVIAYEPVWAIGTGKTATPELAEDVHSFIRNLISELYDEETSQNLRIIYGGSVKPENIEGLIIKENIDGALPGGASLDPIKFSEIIKKM
ncbi:triose-phosphate isomerase [archaeon]|nr:triose-phosphate isomerase [archaeon]MBT4647896.1 triose-phosphate isomerase [archaeon]MBT7393131.1 triose-phosphate isomerase [archaeon]